MDRAQPLLIDAVAAVDPTAHHPVVARLHSFDFDDRPVLRDLFGSPGELVRSRSTVALRATDVGREALVLFESGDRRRPIIIGMIEERLADGQAVESARQLPMSGSVDGRRCIVEGDQEVVLRCGAASITLTRAGNVVIEGRYIVSKSSGYNKLKGAVVDIN